MSPKVNQGFNEIDVRPSRSGRDFEIASRSGRDFEIASRSGRDFEIASRSGRDFEIVTVKSTN